MKKIWISAFLGIFLLGQAWAADVKLLDIRKKIFDTAQEIKDSIPSTKDSYAMLSMFNSCLVITNQLDAYFHMVGIYDAVKKENLKLSAVDYLLSWLRQLQSTNRLNLDSLLTLSQSVDASTSKQLAKLKSRLNELDGILVEELGKVSLLKRSLAPKPPANK